MNKDRLLSLLSLILLSILLVGCGAHDGGNGLLPSSENYELSNGWETLDSAIDNYSKIKVGMTEKELEDYHISTITPNIEVLNWFDACELFPKDSFDTNNLSPGIISFIEAGDLRGKAFRIEILSEREYSKGNTFLYMLNFKRNKKTEGFKFRAFILLVDGVVTYVSDPSGKLIDRFNKTKNPLGPIQGIKDTIQKAIF